MAEVSANKTIAKNTMFLYFRMMVTMLITLYTTRVVLKVLGVDDYGIYQAVGGIVGFLSFINNSLSNGSSRFLTYSLGEGDGVKLKKVFSTTLTAHICLAIIIVAIAETAGLWFLYNKLVIPPDRLSAAVFAFHISLVTAFFSLTQVPYNACIIAHEKMTVFAYVSIIDAALKLFVVYLLMIGGFDKLKLYALLLCLVQIGIILFYRIYCVRHFSEAHFKFFIDKKIFKEIAGFSGWSLLANGAIALNNQGILVLLNMFFSPAIVTARSVSLQIYMAANHFVDNFQTAANPQIVKRYAAKDYDGSKKLLLQMTKYSFYLMLLVFLPICLAARPLLQLWLDEVPEYTVIFLQLIAIQSLFHVFDISFYKALYAKGQIRENAIISPSLGFLQFPIVYVLFKMGFSPVTLSLASLISNVLLGLIVKPVLIIKIVNYTWSDVFSVFWPCLKVFTVAVPIPLLAYLYHPHFESDFFSLLWIVIVCIMSVSCTCWFIGIDGEMRQRLVLLAKKRFTLERD